MYKQKLKKRVLFSRAQTGVVLGVLSIATILYGGFTLYTGKAHAATNNTLNFQARLEGAAGNIAPDGNYNVQFKLYSVSSAGSALWTESYIDENGTTAGDDYRVRVQNGYLSVSLGSRTAFPAGLNWDQDMWITMNIGGTTQTATPTYDGEMSPRLKLTGVPYAFKAGQLAQLNAANGFTSTLQLIQPTAGNQIFQVADQGAAGSYTLCVQGGTACGASTTTLQGAYDNSSSPAVVATTSTAKNIVIKAGTGFDSAALFQVQNAAGSPILNVDSINQRIGVGTASPQTRLEVGANTATDETITVRSQGKAAIDLRSDTANAAGEPGGAYIMFRQDAIDNSSIVGTTQAAGSAPDGSGFNGTTSNSLVIGTMQPHAVHIGTDRKTNLTISATGTATFKNNTDSATAFIIQNAASSPVLGMATDTNKLSIEQGGLDIKGLRNPAVPSLSSTSTGGSLAAATYQYRLAATSGAGETQAIISNPGNVTTTGTTSVNTLSWSGVTYATGYNVYRSTDGGSTWFVNSVPSGTTSITDNGTNFSWATAPATGRPYKFNNYTGDVQMTDGSSLYLSNNRQTQFRYDTNANSLVYGNYNANGLAWIQSDSFAVQDTTGYSNNLRIINTGAATFKNRVNSTDGFKVQNSAGTSILNVDTTNQRVGIGTGTPGTALDLQGAFTQRGMTAPTTSPAGQGIIYFDSTTNKFRVSQNGAAYVDLLGASVTNTMLSDNFDDNSLDTNKWFTFTPGGTIAEINQRLEISSTLASSYSGLTSASKYNMTGQAAGSQLLSAGDQSLVGLQVFPAMIEIDNNNKLNWLVAQNRVIAQKNVAGTVTDVFNAAYSSTVHQYFRVRETGGTTFWETSDNGTAWTIRHSEANPLAVTNVSLLVFMGTFQTEATTTTVHFDNFFAGSLANGPTLQSAYENSYSPATITTTSAAKSIVFKSGSGQNTANAFQVQNAAGVTAFGVDTATDSAFIKHKLVIQGNNGSVPNPDSPLVVAHSGNGAFNLVAGFYAPNLTAGNAAELLIGKNETTNNRGAVAYFHNADGSTLNRMDFGFYGNGSLMVLRADGRVGIGNTAPDSRLQVGANGAANEIITVKSHLSAVLDLQGDTDNATGEDGTAYILFRQDGDTATGARIIGSTQDAGLGPNGATYTNAISNSLLVGTQGGDRLQFGTNSEVHMTMGATGNVGIGTVGDPAWQLSVATGGICVDADTTNTCGTETAGTIKADGAITANAFDLAERYASATALAPGTLVAIDQARSMYVTEASGAYSSKVIGVVSTDPGLVLGWENNQVFADAPHVTQVALAGRVPVKVTDENGVVTTGDPLTSSATKPGYAMKATTRGMIIGYALEPLTTSEANVMTFIKSTWFDPSAANYLQGGQDAVIANLDVTGSIDAASLNVSGATMLTSLNVTESAAFLKDVMVVGHLTVGSITVNGHIVSGGEKPVVILGSASGKATTTLTAQQPTVMIEGNDTAGVITVRVGSKELSEGELVRVTFNKPYGKTPKIVLMPVGKLSATLQTYVDQTATDFILGTNTVPTADRIYIYNYQIIE